MKDQKKLFSTQIPVKVEVEVVKLHFEVNTKAHMVNIIQMYDHVCKGSVMEVDEKTLEEEEVVEVMVEVIEVNNQIATQIATIAGKPRHMAKNYYQKEHDA